MVSQELRKAQLYFEGQIKDILEYRNHLYAIRDNFAQYFSIEKIKTMQIDHYAIGNELPKDGFNFCYTLERQLDGLGRMIGANSFKFGVYFGRIKSDSVYKNRFAKKFGANVNEAFNNVKLELINLIEAGKNENNKSIIENKLSTMFKGKILSTYYPERYLNVFSDAHLEYFLVQFNLDNYDLIWSDAITKREALLKFKNSDQVMKHWSIDLFSYFLYNVYPGNPPKNSPSKDDPLQSFRNFTFPVNPIPEWVSLSIEIPANYNHIRDKENRNANPNYEDEAKKSKAVGERGEKIVIEMEKERLEEAGFPKLAKRVIKAKFDHLGYDIKSFELNGEERFIEVKTTTSKIGSANFFLTINEFEKSQELNNYFVYIVFDILSENPQIWPLKNPFRPMNKNIKMTPISFKVEINTKKN